MPDLGVHNPVPDLACAGPTVKAGDLNSIREMVHPLSCT